MLDVIVDVDVSGLRSAIERTYPDQHIDVQADGGRLILTGKVTDPKMIEDLAKMSGVYSNQIVNSLTLGISHDRQVLLEVKFAEVDRTKFANLDRKSTRLNSSHSSISYAVFCLKKKKITSYNSGRSCFRQPPRFPRPTS